MMARLVKALSSAFVTVNTMIVSISLVCVAILMSVSLNIVVPVRVAATGIMLATCCGTYQLCKAWWKTDTWRLLLLVPIRTRTLRFAFTMLACLVSGMETQIPILVFVGLNGINPLDCVGFIVLGMLCVNLTAAMVSRDSANWHRCVYILSLLTAILLLCTTTIWMGVIPLCMTAWMPYLFDVPLRPVMSQRYGRLELIRFRQSLVANELMDSSTARTNALFGCILMMAFTYIMIQQGLKFPIAFALVGLNSPLTTIISRNTDTQHMLRQLPATGGIYIRYVIELTAFFALVGAPQLIIIAFLSRVPLTGYVATLLLVAAQSAIIAVFLEARHPMNQWKTERDVLKNPRKFIAPCIALMEIPLLGLLYL